MSKIAEFIQKADVDGMIAFLQAPVFRYLIETDTGYRYRVTYLVYTVYTNPSSLQLYIRCGYFSSCECTLKASVFQMKY